MKKVFSDYYNDNIVLNRWQFIGVISLVVVFSGIFGWIYEFIFYFFNGGMKYFYYRGGNFLPWINIYATGAVMIWILTHKFKRYPFFVFLISVISTGILEFFSGFFIFKFTGLRFWDYNTEILNFLNIGGFVCLRSVLFFGISGIFLIYFIIPLFIYISSVMDRRLFLMISIFLASVFLFDEFYNLVIARIFGFVRAVDFYKGLGVKVMNYK